MSDFELQAERTKLARVLDVAEGEVGYLDDLGFEHMRALREGLSDSLFDRYRKSFTGMAKVARLAPLRLSASLSEKVFGPVLAARVAGELPVKTAVGLAERLPTEFLADVSVQLDPRGAREVIANMPPELVAQVTAAMEARREFVTMGRFVDYLSEAALEAAIDAIEHDETLLRVGFFVENKAQLSEVVHLLPRERRQGTIKAAADNDLWPQALALMTHLDDALQAEYGDMVVNLKDAEFAAAMDAIAAYGQWRILTKTLARQDAKTQKRLGEFAAGRDKAERQAVLEQARKQGLTDTLTEFITASGS